MSKRPRANNSNAALQSIDQHRSAHLFVIATSGLFALASVGGTLLTVNSFPMPAEIKPLVWILAGLMVFTVDMISVLCAPAWARANISMKIVGAILLTLIMLVGAGLQANATNAYKNLSIKEKVEALDTRLTDIQSRMDALPTSQEVCIGHGPQNCAERKKGLKDDRKVMEADLKRAQQERDTLSAFPWSLVLLIMGGFQIGCFFIRAWLTAETQQAQRKAVIIADASNLDEAKTVIKDLRAKLREAKAELKEAQSVPQSKGWTPEVIAND